MTSDIKKHLWTDIANAPDAAGVYAWYYSPELTDFDLQQTIAEVNKHRGTAAAEEIIREMLDDRLFRYFREAPYQATIGGRLKPSYVGSMEHKSSVSSSLVQRLAAEPERLFNIRNVLSASAPMFASPIYIGMATRLRTRLGQHKSLIERYRATRRAHVPADGGADASFAWEVATRKISPDRLFVYTCSFAADDGTAVDVENI